MFSKSAKKTALFILAVYTGAALFGAGLETSFADEAGFCIGKTSRVSSVVFDPGSLVFGDARQKRYIAGNIVIAGKGYFSATIGKQINEGLAHTLEGYKDFADLAIAPVLQNPDRYGRKVVNLFADANRRWMQLDLVKAGLAFVNPMGGSEKCLKFLFEAEENARNNKAGIWRLANVIMNAKDVDWKNRVQSFQLVEGVLMSVGKTNARYYLNFGKNWNEDFTVIVAKRRFKRFKLMYKKLKRLTGKKIRIRGWMIQDRGPMIELFHPGQIEIDIQ